MTVEVIRHSYIHTHICLIFDKQPLADRFYIYLTLSIGRLFSYRKKVG